MPLSVMAAASVGTFTYIKGKVDVTETGMPAVSVFKGDEVFKGDIVRTKSGAKAEITFVDGSVLRIAEKSRLEINEYMLDENNMNSRLNLFRGKVQSVVKKVAGRSFGNKTKNRFEVHTPTAVCGVRGTNFFSSFKAGVSNYVFKEGQGYGYSKNRPDQVRMVRAGQAMTVADANQPPTVRPATQSEMNQHTEDTSVDDDSDSDDSDDGSGDDSGSGEESSDEGDAASDSDDAESDTGDDGTNEQSDGDDSTGDDGDAADSGAGDDGTGTGDTNLDSLTGDTGADDTGLEDLGLIDGGTSDSGSLDDGLDTGLDNSAPPADPTTTDPLVDNLIPQEVPSDTTSQTVGFDVPMESTVFGAGSTASLSAEIDETAGSGSLALAGTSPVESFPMGVWGDDTFMATIGDSGEADGYFLGQTGSLEALLSTIYVDSGDIGYLLGDLSGDYTVDDTTGEVSFYAGGSVYRISQGTTTLTPAELSNALGQSSIQFPAPVPGSIYVGEGSGVGTTYSLSTAGIDLGNKLIGIWSAQTLGTFSNPDRVPVWTDVYAQGADAAANAAYYMLGDISGTDDLKGHVGIYGDGITYLDENYLGTVSLTYRGVYDTALTYDNYSGIGAGTFTLQPLAYAGQTGDFLDGFYSLVYNEGGIFEPAGTAQGLIGGLTTPWNNTSSTFIAMGDYDDYGYGEQLLWNAPVVGYSMTDSQYGFAGFTSGIWAKAPEGIQINEPGQIDAVAKAVYMDESGNAGILSADAITGSFYPGTGMWEASGTWVPTYKETFADPVNYDLYSGAMTAKLVGIFGEYSEIFGSSDALSETYFYYSTVDSLASSAAAWGIYNLRLGAGNMFSMDSSFDGAWSANIGGSGEFGTDGYWIGSVDGTFDTDGLIAGTMSGQYLSLSQYGTIQGPVTGLYDVVEPVCGTWTAQSTGTFEGRPLSFSSNFTADTCKSIAGTMYEGDFSIWDESQQRDVAEYEYEYFMSNGTVYYADTWLELDGSDEQEDIYFPDGTHITTYGEDLHSVTVGPWVVGNLSIDQLETPPTYGELGTWESRWFEEWDTYCAARNGILNGLLGGVDNLWTASASSPAVFKLMGTTEPFSETGLDDASVFAAGFGHSEITDGAFSGFISGISESMTGHLYALYVDPDQNAGILKGAFSGNSVSYLDMWEADGMIYPEVVAPASGISADSMQNSLSYGMIGGFMAGMSGADTVIESEFGWGDTLALNGLSDFGIFQLTFGIDNKFMTSQASSSWTAGSAGRGVFGSYEVSSMLDDYASGYAPDPGYWQLSTMGGTFADGVLTGTAGGMYLSMTRYGELSGTLDGTYDVENSGGWQGVLSGTWQNSVYLDFNGLLDGNSRYMTSHRIGYDSGFLAQLECFYTFDYDEITGIGWTNFDDGVSVVRTMYYPDGTYSSWSDDGTQTTYGQGTFTGAVWDTVSLSPITGSPLTTYETYTYLHHSGGIHAFLGGIEDLWTASLTDAASFVLMGEFDDYFDEAIYDTMFSADIKSYNPYYDNCTIWNPDDALHSVNGNGSYIGFMTGKKGYDAEIKADILALYLDVDGNAGFLRGFMNGGTIDVLETCGGNGEIYPIEILQNTGYVPSEFYPGIYGCVQKEHYEDTVEAWGAFLINTLDIPSTAGSIECQYGSLDIVEAAGTIGNQPWCLGVESALYGGTYDVYESTVQDSWFFDLWESTETKQLRKYLVSMTDSAITAGSWSDHQIQGKGYGAWVDMEQAITGVCGADLHGTFDPVLLTWQAAAQWASLDTQTFLSLSQTQAGRDMLAELNIPCIEVGITTLTGTSEIMTVNMNDVSFFAYSTGADPRVWATSDVNGTFSQTPTVNSSVSMSSVSGGELSADFYINNWTGNQWDASVSGYGSLNRTDGAGGTVNVGFSGNAAGTYTGTTSGDFSGTGAGTVDMGAGLDQGLVD